MEMQTVKLFYTNINGLNVNKIVEVNKINDTCDADILCFTETHLREYNNLSIDQYDVMNTTSKTKNNLGRQVKGISLYHKKESLNIEKLASENGDIIIIQISNQQWKEINRIHIILCYRESRESNYADKEYLDKIKSYIEKFKMKHVIMLGDLNSRIGKLNDNAHMNLPLRNSEDLIVNKQGRELINFCNETSLIIANGRFEKGEHTFCRLQNDRCYKSVIDYLLISESILRYLEGFRILEPQLFTDHRPMKFNLKIPLKPLTTNALKNRFKTQINHNKRIMPLKWSPKYDIEKFRQTISFKSTRILKEINDEKLNKSEIYDKLVDANKKSLTTVVNLNKQTIYSEELRLLRKIYKLNVEKYKADQSEQNLNLLLQTKRELNKSIKKEKKSLQQIKLNELQAARANNDTKRYWELLNKSRTKKNTKDKTSLTAHSFKESIGNRNVDVENLNSNRNDETLIDLISPTENNETINQTITTAEIENAVKYSKTSKSSGPDEIVYEMLKNDPNQINILHTLFNKIMIEHETPWHSSWISPIFKKGDKNDVNSYRCLNLSSCIEKLLTRILNDRLNIWLDKYKILHESQTGFRKDHSTIDNIWILKETIQIYKNDKKPLYTCFVDLSKAFDSVQKSRLISKLRCIIPNGDFLLLLIYIIKFKAYKVLSMVKRVTNSR